MIQEDKELLLKDICARFPYGVVIHVDEKTSQADERLYGMRENGGKLLINDAFYIEEIKPYLFPMSSMTEEQKKELEDTLIEMQLKAISDEINGENVATYEIDFYNKHHIDYRGLIPMGLAIDATAKNIYWI